MPGFMQVRTEPVVTDGVPFSCTVLIVGGSPGDVVTIRLTAWEPSRPGAQRAGARPLYSCHSDVPIAADGTGMAVFDEVVLYGADTEARLVADDVASAIPLASGDAEVQVRAP